MKIAEVVNSAAQPIVVQPSAVQHQTRINRIVQQLAIDDAKRSQTEGPTEDEKRIAQNIFRQQKKKADADYAARQQQQATNNAIAAKTVATVAKPTVKRQKRA